MMFMFRTLSLAVCSLVMMSACEQQTASNYSHSLGSLKIKTYDDARPIFWRHVYRNGGSTLYCGKRFKPNERRGINVEHVFPMSWATNGLKCGTRKQCRANSAQFNAIEADMHNLYPSRADVNRERSSFRFGEVGGEKREFGNACDFEVNYRARVAEPAPEVRGEVARSMFYMADRYKANGLVIFEKQARMLYRWHQSDPPTNAEVSRNSLIENLQGNRNRFIDNPDELTRLIKNGHFF